MALIDRKKPASGELDGYLGPGTLIEGTVRFEEVLRIDGRVKGKVQSAKDLIIGEQAIVEADVSVGNLSVAGRLSGKIEVLGRMEIHSGARVSGEIHMKGPRLVIEDGGIFEGRVAMGGAARTAAEPQPETGKVAGFPARGEAS
jgi:cytoskeletal protein CcmA (bactofilin family)